MKIHRIFFFYALVSIFSLDLIAQENLRNQLFGEVEKMFNQAKEKKANFYAPSSYAKAMEYYNEADDYYKRGKNLEDIRESIKNAEAYFAKALDACKLGEITFSSTMGARNDADSAGAQRYSAELWQKADQQFIDAAQELEDGNLKDAKDKGKEAETTYRAAELEAIKTNFLAPARDLLKKADEMDVKENAQKTLQNAWRLANQVDALLKQNRYDTDEARQLASESKYEASHAIYLHQKIERLTNEKKSLEDILLASENEVKRIATALGFAARFDNGLEGAVTEILGALKERDARMASGADALRQADEVIRQKEAEIANLKKQVDMMTQRLGTLSDAEKKLQDEGKELQYKLRLKHEQEETIRKLTLLFKEEEGNVLREGDNIIIRLYGLTFPVGKDVIESQYYPLLSKVQDGIRKFPNCTVTIEGHTDSQGSDDANQTLSERRAKAVAEYLMANMGVEQPINHQGFGESRPIASNDTPDGRAKNRRIDVVIVPEWASSGK